MLEHWLSDLNPVSEIFNNSRSISGVRLFENDLSYNPDFIYVGRTKDFFHYNKSDEVMIIFQNDIISVSSKDLNHVLNRVLEAFDYYDHLEQSLNTAIFMQNPEQEIISLCQNLIGPAFIMQPDYKILACSQNYSDKKVNEFWNNFVVNREAALESIGPMLSSQVVSVMKRHPHMVRFQEPAAAPYQYGIANTYYDYYGTVIGHFIVSGTEPISSFEEDIAGIIMDALAMVSQRRALQKVLPEKTISGDILLTQLLDGEDLQRVSEYFKAVYRISGEEKFRLLCAEVLEDSSLLNAQSILERLFTHGVFCRKANRLIVLFWDRVSLSRTDLLSRLKQIAYIPGICVGLSTSFEDVSLCRNIYPQLDYLMEQNRQEIMFFEDHALNFFVQCSDINVLSLAKHPLVLKLEKIDHTSGSKLCATLLEYLINERSVGKTAEKMYVHKNTVVYRIDKIRAMDMAEFENPLERQYLVQSLFLKTDYII